MKRKRNWVFIVLIAVLLGFPLLTVCLGVIAKGSERVQLTDNYRYLRGPEGEFVIGYDLETSGPELLDKMEQDWRPPKVGPDVDGYRVYRQVIVGHVAKTWEGKRTPAWARQDSPLTPGYFIIDLQTDKLSKALSKQEWLERLRDYGIKREPKLFKPAWYDEVLGRNRVCDE